MAGKICKTLLVDAGNTRLKWSWLENGQRSEQQARVYPDSRDEIVSAQAILTELLHGGRVRRMIAVHVLGDAFSHGVEQICQSAGCELLLVSGTSRTYGIKLAYPNPAQLGADRLVGLVAARALAEHKAAIIIDCGTAVITPGLSLLQDVLFRRTKAKHMDTSLVNNPQIFADSTAAAIGSGCLFSLVGTIEGICQRMQDEMTEQPVKIICGGDALRLHEWLLGDFMLRPTALMDGLQAIAEYD